jgi:predicted  nucleic acid-binding Zn-ribbon protein
MRLFKSKDKSEHSALTTLLSSNQQESDDPNTHSTDTSTATAVAPAPTEAPQAADLPVNTAPAAPVIPVAAPVTDDSADTTGIAPLKQQMKDLAKQYQSLREQLQTKMFVRRDAIKQQLREISANEKRINKQLAAIEAEQKQLTGTNDTDLTAQQDQLSHEKDTLQKQIANLEQQVANIKKSISENDDAIAQNKQAQEQNEAKNAELAKEIKDEADLVAVVQLIEKNKDQVFSLRQQHDQLTKEATAFQEKGARLNDELTNTQDSLNETNHKMDANTKDSRQVVQRLEQARRERHAQLNALKTRQKEATQQQQDIQTQYAAQQKALAAIQDDIQHVFNTDHLIRLFQLQKDHQYGVLTPDFSRDESSDMVAIFRYLEDHAQQPAIFISYAYDPHLANHVQDWAVKNQLHTPTVFNLFTELQKSAPNTAQQMTIPDNDHWRSEWNKDRSARDIYDGNKRLMHVVYQDTDHIARIDYYSENKLSKRSEFNEHGQLSRTLTYSEDGNVQQIDYYRIEGTLVLSFHYVDKQVDNIQMFDTNGLLYTVFNDLDDLAYWWLKAFWKQHPELMVIGRPEDTIFQQLAPDFVSQQLPYFPHVTSTPDAVQKQLKQHRWNQMLVATPTDQQALSKIADRDLAVDYVATADADTLPQALTLTATDQEAQ